MSAKLLLLFLLVSFFCVLNSDPVGSKCEEDLDCGSNIKYEVCDSGKCRFCQADSECTVNKDNDFCADAHFCAMNQLVHNFDASTIVTVIAIFVGAFVAAGGGLGGGGIFVPVFILLLQFDTKSAAALSQATILGGSIVNLLMNFRESHPNPHRYHRPLTDFSTILILEPMLLGGTVVGVLLNEILPDPIILVSLILVLTIALYRMVKKGASQWKKENAEKAQETGQGMLGARLLQDDSNPSMHGVCAQSHKKNNNNNDDACELNSEASRSAKYHDLNVQDINIELLARKSGQTVSTLQALDSQQLMELHALVAKESQVWIPMFWMSIVWIIVSLFALLRSGDFLLHVETCSTLYWVLEFGVFPCLFLITYFIAKMNMNRFQRKLQLHWRPAEGDIEWNVTKSIVYPLIAALSGLLGGMLGIGGGMIVSPLLLELGVLPRVASATSAVAVLMTSSSSTFQKVLLNMIRYDYMAFFAAIGVIGTFIGQTAVNVAIKKWGRNSIVIIAVATVIAAAVVLMTVNSIMSRNMTWTFYFDSIC